MKGVWPPEYHTGTVATALVSPETSDSVESVAPATSPPVASVAPTGFGETVANDKLGVVSSGM
jgi:hypothetical protein